jgi:hypothetical protein
VKNPADLTREQLEAAVTEVRNALYLDDGALNADREWDADACQAVADVLHRHNLAPTVRYAL